MNTEDIYSEDIDKVCRLCVHAEMTKGTKTHVHCTKTGGYTPIGNTCESFKYDVFKRQLRRKKSAREHHFTAEDFSL